MHLDFTHRCIHVLGIVLIKFELCKSNFVDLPVSSDASCFTDNHRRNCPPKVVHRKVSYRDGISYGKENNKIHLVKCGAIN